jgi:hypothetical protein
MGQIYLGDESVITDAYVDALGIAHGGLLTPEMVAWINHKMSTHWEARGAVTSGVDVTLEFGDFKAIARYQSSTAIRIGFARATGAPAVGASYNNLVIESGAIDTSGGYIWADDLGVAGTMIAENRSVSGPLFILGMLRGGGKGYLVNFIAASLTSVIILANEVYDLS